MPTAGQQAIKKRPSLLHHLDDDEPVERFRRASRIGSCVPAGRCNSAVRTGDAAPFWRG